MRHRPSAHEEQVAECEPLRAVPRQAAVAGLQIPELALGHAELMLDPGPHLGDDPADVCVDRMQPAALT